MDYWTRRKYGRGEIHFALKPSWEQNIARYGNVEFSRWRQQAKCRGLIYRRLYQTTKRARRNALPSLSGNPAWHAVVS